MEIIINKNEIIIKYSEFEDEKKLLNIFTKIKKTLRYNSINFEKNSIRFNKVSGMNKEKEKEIKDCFEKMSG